MQKKKKSILSFSITQEFLKNVAGDYAFDVIKTCEKKGKSITDEEIGKSVPVKITEIRAVLNRLHYRGIACYNKSRNPKTGWYSYTWNIKTRRIAELLLEQYSEEVQKLEKRKQFEKTYLMFSCGKKCASLPFEVAAEYEFKCPECGETMESMNSQKSLRGANKRIKTIMEEAKEIEKMS